jgi:hypothetical protein
MSAATADCSCACPDPTVVLVPGSPGADGSAGQAGAAGIDSFTLTTSQIVTPAIGNQVLVNVVESAWSAPLQTLVISDGTNVTHWTVVSIVSTITMNLQFLGYPGDATPGTIIATNAKVSPSGVLAALAAPLPTAITDNSTGTASNTIVAETGQFTFSIPFRAAAITGNVLLFTYTPAFAFKIIRISASVVDAITTGGRAATLTTAIGGTPTTGGVVVMSGAYALGAQQASSAAITAANVGTNVQAITITASAVTAFAEGGFIVEMQIQNMDTADAIKSLSTHINDLITSLT